MKLQLNKWFKIRVIKLKQFWHAIKVSWFNMLNWLYFKKRLFLLFWADAPKEQIWLEKGSYYLRKGTQVQVGQPINVPMANGKVRLMYIKNLYFNFNTNKITANYNTKPIKGKSEPFIKTQKELNAIKNKRQLLSEKK